MLMRRREILAQGAEHVGWKVGFNLPDFRKKLGLDRPAAGFLTTDTVLDDGATWPLADNGPVWAECEVAVELGDDGRSIAALLPALELVDPIDLEVELEQILAGNIFHRGVVFGPRAEKREPGAARVLVNGELRHSLDAEFVAGNLDVMVEAVGSRLVEAGEELRPGDRIITGVLAPPYPAEPGDNVRLELDAVGGVELGFS